MTFSSTTNWLNSFSSRYATGCLQLLQTRNVKSLKVVSIIGIAFFLQLGQLISGVIKSPFLNYRRFPAQRYFSGFLRGLPRLAALSLSRVSGGYIASYERGFIL